MGRVADGSEKAPHDSASRQRKPPHLAAGEPPITGREGKVRTRTHQAPDAADRAGTPVDAAAVREAPEAVGALVPFPESDDLPVSPAELEQLEQEIYARLDSLPEPLGLTEAVIEDRGPW